MKRCARERDGGLAGMMNAGGTGGTGMRWICLLLLLLSAPLTAMEALVDSDWLAANKKANKLFLLDIQVAENYRRAHIAGAVNAPYVRWRGTDGSGIAGMLPPKDRLERLLGDLGIANRSAVVIIATGNRPADMAASSRVFWTLKAMGHGQVAILNGGLVDYARQHAADLEAIPRQGAPVPYKATVDQRIVAGRSEVQAALHDGTQLLDARTLGEYAGVIRLNPKERAGTIPGARHIPFDWFVDTHGRMRDKKTIKSLFRYAGLNPDRDGTIHFCHTGNRAALGWFVDYAILGNRNAKLYDASMSEWAVQKALPMESRFDPRQER